MEEKFKWDETTQGESQRPYRLWDAQAKKNMPFRFYKDKDRACIGALIECKRAKPGFAVEVYDCTTMRLVAQYRRTPTGMTFLKG